MSFFESSKKPGYYDIKAYRREPGFFATDSILFKAGIIGEENDVALEDAYIHAGKEGVAEAIEALIAAKGELQHD